MLRRTPNSVKCLEINFNVQSFIVHILLLTAKPGNKITFSESKAFVKIRAQECSIPNTFTQRVKIALFVNLRIIVISVRLSPFRISLHFREQINEKS